MLFVVLATRESLFALLKLRSGVRWVMEELGPGST
jgi:hypothetical protein